MLNSLFKVIVEVFEGPSAPGFREAHLSHVLEVIFVDDHITRAARSRRWIHQVAKESLRYSTALPLASIVSVPARSIAPTGNSTREESTQSFVLSEQIQKC